MTNRQDANRPSDGVQGDRPSDWRLSKRLLCILLFTFVTLSGRCSSADEITVGPKIETPLTPEATQFLRGMALVLLPETYSDDDDWGKEKRIQSGLNIERDGLKIHTSRRWKNVNHGTWRRVDAKLIDPEERFKLAVSLLPREEQSVPRYRIRTSMRLNTTGRQQGWSLGAKLYSISAEAWADVSVEVDVRFRSEVTKTDDGSKLRVLPYVERSRVRLEGFSLRRISHAKGSAVRGYGDALEGLIRRAVRKKGDKLAAKVNSKVQKKPERFEVPAGILAVFGHESDAAPVIDQAAEAR